ncbi:uncharacterized protein APUU_60903A [Aspergillus puulaauensis]|uniref:Uncharacterized protein n=1 Tax=Aspergillus puulaauensis TaxID=1220207 RepID=A0A7R7XU95_9EURO|nr:uncharacterized protein APUU_60903A [Aspergillus puulaauensis]BCS27855.1 hypothetical protein APUU_60903A [Aspergillus puulaauensis]
MALALDLSYVNQSLPREYESDEEDVSESEGHCSPFDSHKRSATLDSIMSVGDAATPVDKPAFPRLLSPFSSGKTSRPVSMDTVKRSSSATFVTEPCTIFDRDDDDDMILELPSPDSTTPLQSPIFLQPSVYVPSEPLTSSRNSLRSSSAASAYSDDDSDVCVAEQVTYVEHAKPSIILISPTATSPSTDGSVYSNDEAAKSQPLLGETSMDRGRSRYTLRPAHSKTNGSLSALDTLQDCSPVSHTEPQSAPAMSFRARSMSFSRPQTPATESRRRQQREPSRRPPSAQSTATFSLFPTQASSYSQVYPGLGTNDSRTRSISCSHSAASSEYSLASSQSASRTASPSPYCSPAYNRSRSGSLYSISSVSAAGTQAKAKRPPLPYRASMIKGASSLRAQVGSSSSSNSTGPGTGSMHTEHGAAQTSQMENSKSKTRRKKSVKQVKPESESSSAAKSFVGFMLRGKRKSVIKNF